MKTWFGILLIIIAGICCDAQALANEKQYDGSPPFRMSEVQSTKIQGAVTAGEESIVYGPKNAYNIFIKTPVDLPPKLG